ncbi:MAG: hypothetical protein Kow0042_09610 [Calditrichia bacterium]
MKKFFVLIFEIIFVVTSVFAQISRQQAEAFGDQLVIGVVGTTPEYLNPFKIDHLVEKQLVRLIFGTGLIQRPDRFGQSPPLISRYILSSAEQPSGLEWKYVLRRNISFHNGISLRNNDVKFTFEFLRKFNGSILNRNLDFENIREVRLSGDLEFHFILKERDDYFDQKLSDVPILSEEYYKELPETGYDLFRNRKPLGYGPFSLLSRSEQEITLTYHSNYVYGRPFLNRIVYKFFTDEQQLIDEFIRGDVDMMEIRDRLTAQRIHQVLKNEIVIFTTPRPEKKLYFILFNVNRSPSNNPLVRKAIRLAVNPMEIVQRLAEQNGHAAFSILDRTHADFFRGLADEIFRPSESIRLLEKEGWQVARNNGIRQKQNDELSFELIYEQNSFLEESIARTVKINLAELGINVQPRPLAFPEKERRIADNDFTSVIYSYSYYEEDVYNALKLFYYNVLRSKASQINYYNPTIEKMFARADRDPMYRKQTIQRLQIALHQDSPLIPLYFDESIIYAVNNRFQKIRVSFNIGKIYYYRLNPFENWFVPKPMQKYQVW